MNSLLKNNQKEKLEKELIEMKENLNAKEVSKTHEKNQQEAVGELSMYDNHPADMGTELFEREKDIALMSHAESELNKVNEALSRINTDTYGICEVCRKPIQYERLEIVPYTTLCIEHAKLKESTVLNEASPTNNENTFEQTMDGRAKDYENSFDEVAEFGTSDSPQDFTDSENPTYTDEDNQTKEIDEVVGKSITDDTEN